MGKFFAAMLAGWVALGAGARANVSWEPSYDAALARARKEKKLVMVDVYTDWCGWCKKLDKDTYSNRDVEARLTKEFIAIKINPEKSVQNSKLAKQFGTHAYPHIVFLDAEGNKISEILGYLTAEKFLKRLDQITEETRKK
jgi:thiol:disulfide interchange protein